MGYPILATIRVENNKTANHDKNGPKTIASSSSEHSAQIKAIVFNQVKGKGSLIPIMIMRALHFFFSL